MSVSFARAALPRDREALLAMNIAYIGWVADGVAQHFNVALPDLLGAPIPDYADAALEGLCAHAPPDGVFYIVCNGDAVAGMGGLRRIGADRCEMKRVYVKPSHRGGGLGAQIARKLIADAQSFGYTHMALDTGPFMTAAHRVYEDLGFRDIAAYPEAELPPALHAGWRFMARAL